MTCSDYTKRRERIATQIFSSLITNFKINVAHVDEDSEKCRTLSSYLFDSELSEETVELSIRLATELINKLDEMESQ